MQGGALNFENFNLDYSVIEGEELVLAPTFKFTIDSITPDVSYEWYVDKKLQTGETGPTYTFKAEKSGTYQGAVECKTRICACVDWRKRSWKIHNH